MKVLDMYSIGKLESPKMKTKPLLQTTTQHDSAKNFKVIHKVEDQKI